MATQLSVFVCFPCSRQKPGQYSKAVPCPLTSFRGFQVIISEAQVNQSDRSSPPAAGKARGPAPAPLLGPRASLRLPTQTLHTPLMVVCPPDRLLLQKAPLLSLSLQPSSTPNASFRKTSQTFPPKVLPSSSPDSSLGWGILSAHPVSQRGLWSQAIPVTKGVQVRQQRKGLKRE